MLRIVYSSIFTTSNFKKLKNMETLKTLSYTLTSNFQKALALNDPSEAYSLLKSAGFEWPEDATESAWCDILFYENKYYAVFGEDNLTASEATAVFVEVEYQKNMETLTREEYLEIIQQAEAMDACEGNLQKAKEFYASGDWAALHRIVVGCQYWLRLRGILKEMVSGIGERYHDNGQLSARGTYVDGKECGLWEYYHDNGQLRQRGTYVDGKWYRGKVSRQRSTRSRFSIHFSTLDWPSTAETRVTTRENTVAARTLGESLEMYQPCAFWFPRLDIYRAAPDTSCSTL